LIYLSRLLSEGQVEAKPSGIFGNTVPLRGIA
jgi:hypothetical protein